MADVHSKQTRSYNMSQIKGKNTKPEMLVRKFLFSKGFRYKLHVNNLPGRPDIVLPKYDTVIFVHGCFWHGHENCRYFVIPKTRVEWWSRKIFGNQLNDVLKNRELIKTGWKVITVWECELKPNTRIETLRKILKIIERE
ncbi:MAG: DNA mismatch endonuclease Vsr [Bacteroidetes bacterium]|nr:DNA mismatch endonuclease Vsr [Bacteroidota bacterium]